MCGCENGKRFGTAIRKIPTLFGNFFEIPSLHASSFLKCFFFVTCFFWGGGGGGGGGSKVSLQRCVDVNWILDNSDMMVIFFRAD